MLAIILASTGAFIFGAADFVGGLASRRMPAVRVTLISATVGAVIFGIVALTFSSSWSSEALIWGALSGVAAVSGIAALYACLAIGPMSVLAPVTAVISGAVPVLWSLGSGTGFGWATAVALGLVLVGGALIGFSPFAPAAPVRRRGLVLSVAAGLLFGAFYILLDVAPDDSGMVPLFANRVVGVTLLAGALLVIRVVRGPTSSTPSRSVVPMAIGAGVLDATANILLLLALRAGDLAAVAAITSLYPAGTIALAALVEKERISRSQWAGVVLALTGGVLLAMSGDEI